MSPPASLDAVGARLWKQYAPVLIQLGVLTPLDTTTLEVYCNLYSQHLAALAVIREKGATVLTSTGYPSQRPEVAIAGNCARLMLQYGRDLGLTPAVRARLEASGGEGDSLEDFLAG
jgi:P27 family predicted phage terminase small subunit